MKKATKWIALMLVLCMALSLTACNPSSDSNTSEPAEPQTTESQSTESQLVEKQELTLYDSIYISDAIDMGQGRGNAYNYLRFHENGVFYYAQLAQPGSSNGGGMSVAGYYEVVNEPIQFYDTMGAEQTAEYYILCYNFDGTEYGIHQSNSGQEGTEPAYDNIIPVLEDVLYGVWYSNMTYTHLAEHADFTADTEIAKEVINFVKEAGSTESLILKHNGTFEDLLNIADGEYYEGNWTQENGVYTLTENATSQTATLQISEDSNTAVYVDFNGNTLNLINAAAPAAPAEGMLQVMFKGEFMVQGMFPGAAAAKLYDNGVADLAVSVDMNLANMGIVEMTESGTWELTADYKMIITVPTEGGEDRVFTAQPVDAQGTYKFLYSFSIQGAPFEAEMTKTELTAAVFYGEFLVNGMFPGTSSITLVMDGSVKCDSSIDMSAAGMSEVSVSEEGAWTYDDSSDTYTLTIGEKTYTASKNEDSVYTFTYLVSIQGSTGMQEYEVPVVAQ